MGAMALGLWSACGPMKTKIVSGDDTPLTQSQRGMFVYGQSCAGCHGESGEGDADTPALVGEGALPRDPNEGAEPRPPFDTAGDVFAYVKGSMPPTSPGSLSDAEYWAVVRYLVEERGATVQGDTIAPGLPLR
jgi:mono/diheme cytochrome c family protein